MEAPSSHANGEIVAEGTPEDVAREPKSYTGHYLKPLLDRSKAVPAAVDAPAKKPRKKKAVPREAEREAAE